MTKNNLKIVKSNKNQELEDKEKIIKEAEEKKNK